MTDAAAHLCWLCGRPLGRRTEWHHPLPKQKGGRDTVPVNPLCHRTIHATLSNAELARGGGAETLRAHPVIARYLTWVEGKPADFHAPTRKRR